MEVGTCATACVAAQTDRIAGLYLFILSDELLRHVSVVGLQSVVVADDDILAVASWLVFHDTYLTTEGSADGVAYIDLDVEALVLASPAGTEVRGDHAAISRHAETAQVDGGLIGQNATRVVSQLIVPLIIEVACGILQHLLFDQSVEHYRVNSLHLTVNGSLTSQKILSCS